MSRPRKPVDGIVYWAPVAHADTNFPLVYGEAHGFSLDEYTGTGAVLYSTEALARAALADPAVWHPENVEHVRVLPVVLLGRYRVRHARPDELPTPTPNRLEIP